MNNLVKIAEDAYADELQSLYDNGYEPGDEYTQPEPIAPAPSYTGELIGGGLAGSGLMAGLGALRNRFSHLPMSGNLVRNAILGAIIGGAGAEIPILMDKLRNHE